MSDTMNEIVRWAKPAVLLNPELLRKKDAIGLFNTAWVYWPPLAALTFIPQFLLSLLWVVGPFTMQAAGVAWLCWNAFFLVLFGVLSLILKLNRADDPTRLDRRQVDTPYLFCLNYAGRKKLCKYDRNRRRVIHTRVRKERYPETDRDYCQYSVWPEASGGYVMMTIIEHMKPGRLTLRRRVRIATLNGNYLSNQFEGNFETLLEHQQKMEVMAEKMEDEQYGKAVGGRTVMRDAMMLRR